MEHATKLQVIIFLALLALFSNGNTCKQTGTTDSNDNCGMIQSVLQTSIIHYDTVKYELFNLVTPDARNDCEAHYILAYYYARPSRAQTDTSEPPLFDLEHAFQPAGELAYFPHPFPTRSFLTSTGNVWTIDFKIGNKNSGLPSTDYSIITHLASTNPNDSVKISGEIDYYPLK